MSILVCDYYSQLCINKQQHGCDTRSAQICWPCPFFFFFLEPLHKFKNSGSCAVTSTEFNKEDILRTEKRKRIILVITSPLSAFTLCVVFCWNKSLHAVVRAPIHGQAFARVLYTMHDSHLPRTTCLNIILHVGQKCASKCKCLHKSHYHPTPHTRPISGLI